MFRIYTAFTLALLGLSSTFALAQNAATYPVPITYSGAEYVQIDTRAFLCRLTAVSRKTLSFFYKSLLLSGYTEDDIKQLEHLAWGLEGELCKRNFSYERVDQIFSGIAKIHLDSARRLADDEKIDVESALKISETELLLKNERLLQDCSMELTDLYRSALDANPQEFDERLKEFFSASKCDSDPVLSKGWITPLAHALQDCRDKLIDTASDQCVSPLTQGGGGPKEDDEPDDPVNCDDPKITCYDFDGDSVSARTPTTEPSPAPTPEPPPAPTPEDPEKPSKVPSFDDLPDHIIVNNKPKNDVDPTEPIEKVIETTGTIIWALILKDLYDKLRKEIAKKLRHRKAMKKPPVAPPPGSLPTFMFWIDPCESDNPEHQIFCQRPLGPADCPAMKLSVGTSSYEIGFLKSSGSVEQLDEFDMIDACLCRALADEAKKAISRGVLKDFRLPKFCPDEKERLRTDCISNPYGPDDRPRKECLVLASNDVKSLYEAQSMNMCALIYCPSIDGKLSGEQSKATFVSKTGEAICRCGPDEIDLLESVTLDSEMVRRCRERRQCPQEPLSVIGSDCGCD